MNKTDAGWPLDHALSTLDRLKPALGESVKALTWLARAERELQAR